MFVEVALDLPIDMTFYYKVPEVVSSPPAVGKRVIVPFGHNNLLKTGIILSVKEKIDDNFPTEKIKDLFDIPDEFPLFTTNTLKVAKWISNYYCASLGETLFSFLPSGFVVSESFVVKLKTEEIFVRLTPSEKKLLEVIKTLGSSKVSFLRRKVKLSNFYSVLKSLIVKGVLEREELIEKDSVPTEEFAVLINERDEENIRGKRTKELFKYLKLRKKVRLKELREIGFSSQIIKKLVDRGTVEILEERILLENKPQELVDNRKIKLTPSQQRAFEEITKVSCGKFLLYGITGSGKMEVYLKVVEDYVRRGKSALILVPELLLTPELRARVESYFGKSIGIYHGKLSEKEKVSTWLKAVTGEAKVFIGTRASVLLPIKDLGLIVVDEEHDSSYKERQKPYYHARDVALKRAEIENFPIVLVSATPSVETFYKVEKGEIEKLELKERVSTLPLPFIKVVNLQKAEKVSIFSKELLNALENTVKKREQVLLFINRRGFFATSFCPNCGFTVECESCAVPVVYHKQEKKSICHICGKRYKPIYRCPSCKTRLEFKGYGTERVEEEIRILYPEFRVVRLDQDTVRDPKRGAKLIKEIKEGEFDVIVGTQIVSKSHNFPNLTLVGILMADFLGGAPDYRVSERIFQTIVHTTGRAGRFKPGAAIVQTFNPDLPAIKMAVEYRFEDFYKEELDTRKILNYPPFVKSVLLEFQLENFSRFEVLEKKFNSFREKISSFFYVPKLSPAPVPKVMDKYRFISFLRTADEEKFWDGINFLKREISVHFRGINCRIDIDPVRIV